MIILLLPVALLAGVWTHEILHAVAVRVLGGEILNLDLWQLHIDYRVATAARDKAVRHAPFAAGMVILPLITRAFSWTTLGFLLLSWWIAVTLTGGKGEFGIIPN